MKEICNQHEDLMKRLRKLEVLMYIAIATGIMNIAVSPDIPEAIWSWIG